MRAAIMRDKKLVVDNIPTPAPGAGEALVKTLACGICGSDLHALKHAEKMVEGVAQIGRAVRDGSQARHRDGSRILRGGRRLRAADAEAA